MKRNLLYGLVIALAVVAGILGFRYYQAQQTTGIEIEVNGSGISIEAQ